MKSSTCAVVAAALILFGCGRTIDNKEAIRQGVIEHLSGRAGLDVKSMQVDIASVTFRQNEADAVVSFRPKGAPDASAGMQMQYTLEKKGDKWVVKGKRESGSSPHGAMAPPPDAKAAETPGAAMPPGHPPVGKTASPGTGK